MAQATQLIDWNLEPKVTDWDKYVSKLSSEDELADRVEANIQKLFLNIYSDNLLGYDREYEVGKSSQYGRGRRCDFFLHGESVGNIIWECKNPTYDLTELQNGISQLLGYYSLAKRSNILVNRLCLLTTGWDDSIRDIIHDFSLPIEVILVGDNHIMKLME